MIDLPRGDSSWQRGTWRPWRDWDFTLQQQIKTAAVACGGCGRAMSVRKHTISADGSLSPSLVCPHGCGWHVFVRLVGWQS